MNHTEPFRFVTELRLVLLTGLCRQCRIHRDSYKVQSKLAHSKSVFGTVWHGPVAHPSAGKPVCLPGA